MRVELRTGDRRRDPSGRRGVRRRCSGRATSSSSPGSSERARPRSCRGSRVDSASTEHVASPTFTLVREYIGGRLDVAHVDVYRLERVQDVVDLGARRAGRRRRGAARRVGRRGRGASSRPTTLRVRARPPGPRRDRAAMVDHTGRASWLERWERLGRPRSLRGAVDGVIVVGIETSTPQVSRGDRERAARSSARSRWRARARQEIGDAGPASSCSAGPAWSSEQVGGDRGRHRAGAVHRAARRRRDGQDPRPGHWASRSSASRASTPSRTRSGSRRGRIAAVIDARSAARCSPPSTGPCPAGWSGRPTTSW